MNDSQARQRALLTEAVRTGFSEIWAHKLRSLLTLIGMMMGVFALICIFSLFHGLKSALSQALSEGGWSRILYLYSQPPENPHGFAWLSAWRGISFEDVDAIRGLSVVRAATAGVQAPASIRRGTKEYKTDVVGVDGQYLDVRSGPFVSKGRWISAAEEQDRRRVCVVGAKLASELFPAGAIGEEINLNGIRVPIVGVLRKPKGLTDEDPGYDEERSCYLPVTTVATYFAGTTRPQSVQIRVVDGVAPGAAMDDVRDLILRRHSGIQDFGDFNVAEFLLRISETLNEILDRLDIVVGAIAGISLVVGGLGIVSVLLISIRERVFEIGVRKAVGATDRDLLVQLLVESTVLAGLGAAFGSFFAFSFTAIASLAARAVLPTGLPFSFPGMLLACLFALGIGVFSGLYPALTVSRMKPVDALSGN